MARLFKQVQLGELAKRLDIMDENKDGFVQPIKLKQALRESGEADMPEVELNRFIRFLDKDKRGMIDYQRLLEQVRMKGRGVPLREAILSRLQRFMD